MGWNNNNRLVELTDVVVVVDGVAWIPGPPGVDPVVEVSDAVIAALRAHPAVEAVYMHPDDLNPRHSVCFRHADGCGGGVWAALTLELFDMMLAHPDTVALLPFALVELPLAAMWRTGTCVDMPPPRPTWRACAAASVLRRLPEGTTFGTECDEHTA